MWAALKVIAHGEHHNLITQHYDIISNVQLICQNGPLCCSWSQKQRFDIHNVEFGLKPPSNICVHENKVKSD